jgi:hypothetical protein
VSRRLLAIIELGGYPNLMPLYQRLGFGVDIANSQRKARTYLKKTIPDVVVAEFNVQSDFRDRSSNLETLCAVLQKHPEVKLVVFYFPEHEAKLRALRERFTVHAAIPFPVTEDKVEAALQDVLAA